MAKHLNHSGGHHGDEGHAAGEHIVPPRTYVIILSILMALLIITVVFSWIDFDAVLPGKGWSTAVALLIAVVKAVLIIMVFMHVKYSPKITWAFAAAAFVWLGIFLVLTMSDYVARTIQRTEDINPKGPEFVAPPEHKANYEAHLVSNPR